MTVQRGGQTHRILFDAGFSPDAMISKMRRLSVDPGDGFAPQQAFRDSGWEPDPLVLDDQALILHVAGKGLVALTGCGHAGVVNITRYARRLSGIDDVYAVLGGFHLGGPLFEPLIPRDELEKPSPAMIVPARCTGRAAQRAFADRFPDAFVPNSVGTRFEL